MTESVIEEELARYERRQRENANRRPKTPEQRARNATRARLRSCRRGIEELAADLERVHNDRSGGYRFALLWLPMFAERMRGPSSRPGLLDQFERIEHEAAAGCTLSAAFVTQYGELLRLCDHLRYEMPPPARLTLTRRNL